MPAGLYFVLEIFFLHFYHTLHLQQHSLMTQFIQSLILRYNRVQLYDLHLVGDGSQAYALS